MEIVSNVDSWEDNWLFQKKKKHKIKTVAQVSVPMLVPNPSEKYRALIGDVDVDETSDLSECSDSIIEELTDYNSKFAEVNRQLCFECFEVIGVSSIGSFLSQFSTLLW